jgi:predicted enzyme related to lactoylglutathione lyase
MITGVSKVRVGVRDQDRAKRFWTETLGCEVVQDESYGEQRWLEVRLPDGVVVVLEQSPGPIGVNQHDQQDQPTRPGQPNTAVFLACDDVDETWRELASAGAAFAQEPIDMPFGRWALLEDSEGNRIPLQSRR